MSRGTQAIINLSNLKHNFKLLSKLAPSKLVLVVKADAYGHGLKQIVTALDGVDCFAVATIDEALVVRKYKQKARILMLEGFFDQQELEIALDNNFDCVIHQKQQLQLFTQLNSTKKINIWLKYDSGMNRLGFDDDAFADAISLIKKHKNINELILMSHFASANEKNNAFTQKQMHQFTQYCKDYPVSLSNSSALLNKQNLQDEWCRVGISLFGVSPIEAKEGQDFGLKPVMSLKTNVIATKIVKKEDGIGYSQTYHANEDKKIAIIGIGYGDGYPWILSKQAYVKINNHKATILGRVSMDMMAIDISTIPHVKVGDSVNVWGIDDNSSLPIEIVARHAQTIPYVLLCQITSRVHYHYV